MKLLRSRRVVILAILIVTLGEFVLDVSTPLGIADWIGYFIPLLLSVYLRNRFYPLILAAILSILMVCGLYLSLPGLEWHMAVVNRCIGASVLWLIALLTYQWLSVEAEVQRVNRALTTISNCNQVMVRAASEKELLEDICRIIVTDGGYRFAWVGFAENDAEKSVRPAAFAGEENGYLEKANITWADTERGQGPTGTAIRTGKVSICHNMALDPKVAPWRNDALNHGYISSIVLPFTDGEKVLGALSIYSGQPDSFNAAEVKLLKELADDLAFGIQTLRTRAEQQRAKEELRQSERLYHSVVSAMAEGLVVQGPDGKIITANPAALQIQGRSMEQMRGRTSSDSQWQAIHDDGTPFPGDEHPTMVTLRTGTAQTNVVMGICRPNGERRWISINSEPLAAVAGEKPYAVVATFHDITEIRAAAERIREQAQLLELAQDAIVVRDLNNKVLYWNKGAERIFGWTAREAMGQESRFLLHIGMFKYEQAQKSVLEKDNWQGELLARTKGGIEVLLESRWTLVRDVQGEPKSILSISTDVTERKKLENQFYRAQRMESLGTLASGIAHDLNNILTPLLVSVQLLKDKVSDKDGRQLLDHLEIYIQRGASLIKQVLSFGRGVEGEKVPVQPVRIVREIEQIVHETFPKSVEFDFHCAPDLWRILGDPTQIYQVLLNLCLNARDAMPDGGKLSIRIQNVVLDSLAAGINVEAKPGSYICISVTDTGTGIPKEIQEKIFEPFFTTKATGKGTGLGLSTSLGIVKSHGGFINCYSEEGKGSTFRVYLPADAASVTGISSPEKAVAGATEGHGETILVVDDEEAIREVVRKTLEKHNYVVVTAVNGAEAVSLYKEQMDKIAAVITDMAMPVMDGAAAISALKALNPKVRIIASTGLSLRDNIGRAEDAGVHDFLFKPYATDVLLEKLAHVLSGDGAD